MARTPQLLNIYSGTDATGVAQTIVAEDMETAAHIYKSTNDADPIILQRTKANVQCALPDVYVTFTAEAYNVTTGSIDKKCSVTPTTFTVLAGTKQIFTAIPADGYEFVKWQLDGEDYEVDGTLVTDSVVQIAVPEGTGSRTTIRACFKLVD